MKSTITATVKRIEKLSISLSDIHANGDWISYSILIRVNPKKFKNEIREGDRIRFIADLKIIKRREFDGDTWDEIEHYKILNPSNFEILNPNPANPL